MPRKMPPFVKPVCAKGKMYYFFRTGQKKPNGAEILKRLPALNAPDFGEKYAAFMGHRTRRADVPQLLTFAALCDEWEASKKFRGYAKGTQKLYRISMEHVRKELPTAPAGEITQADIAALITKMEDRPGAANSVLRTLKSIYKWARSKGRVTNDPARNIEEFEVGEHAAWDDKVLAKALKADDDRVRLGVHMLYYTAQRIEDVVQIHKDDIRNGAIYLTQQKTGIELEIPIHRELVAELAKHDHPGDYVIRGHKLDRSLHQQTLREAIQEWVLEHTGAEVVPHGLRKNGVMKLLEVGCATGDVSAISGQTLKMVEHYAKKRDRAKAARKAMKMWEDHPE